MTSSTTSSGSTWSATWWTCSAASRSAPCRKGLNRRCQVRERGRRRRARTTLGPAARDLVLLADPRPVAEPHLYVGGIDAEPARERLQARTEVLWDGPPLPAGTRLPEQE